MNAKQKIEQLTRSWYGYSLFAALLSLLSVRASGVLSLMIGLGLSLVFDVVALIISVAVVTFIGRKLLARSNGMRLVAVVFSGLFSVLGAVATVEAGWTFLTSWTLASISGLVLMAVGTMMYARSFRVLTSTTVRAYFV